MLFLKNGGWKMRRFHDSLLLVAATFCFIPFSLWAQEGGVKDSNVLPSNYVIKFERMGGYLGSFSVFWIYPDGQTINALGETGKLSPKSVKQWTETAALPPVRTPADSSMCSDCSFYSVSLYQETGARYFLLSPSEVDKYFPGIIKNLQSLKWKPLMRPPLEDNAESFGRAVVH
jgi:hypothetical protein